MPYETVTDDGWILTLFRITGRVGSEEKPTVRENEKSILMQHGMFTNAAHQMTYSTIGKPW